MPSELAALEAKAALYRLFSAAFVEGTPRPPEPGAVAALAATLGWALPAFPPAPQDPRAEARAVFGHNLSPDCPPYESHYGKIGVFRQTQQLADLAGFYRAFGVEAGEGDRRPDHLPIELEFAALLCLKEACAERKGLTEETALCRSARARFLAEHLGRWIDAFAEALERKAPGGYYAALAKTAAACVGLDAASLGTAPKERVAGPFLEEPEDACASCIGGGDDVPA